VPNDPTSHHRLKSPCASIMSRPYASHGTGPPDRNAETSSGITPAIATNDLQNAAIQYGLSGSRSGSACPVGNPYRRWSGSADTWSTVTIPAAAYCSSHSRAYRGKIPVSLASWEAVIGPFRSNAR
jgi:hypothetical protein